MFFHLPSMVILEYYYWFSTHRSGRKPFGMLGLFLTQQCKVLWKVTTAVCLLADRSEVFVLTWACGISSVPVSLTITANRLDLLSWNLKPTYLLVQRWSDVFVICGRSVSHFRSCARTPWLILIKFEKRTRYKSVVTNVWRCLFPSRFQIVAVLWVFCRYGRLARSPVHRITSILV